MKKYLISLLLAVFVIPGTVLAEDPPTIIWEKTYDQGLNADDWGEDIAVDASGFIYVTGNVWRYGYNYSWCTIKYDANGTIVWNKIYDSGYGEDIACAVDVDNSGNVYVVGYTPDNTIHDWRYIKYDADGNLVWDKTRDWGPDVDQRCHDIVVDTIGGHLYMTGEFIGTDGTCDYLTVKCDLDGNYISENSWSGGTNVYSSGRAIAIYQVGSVWYIYVTGIFGSAGLSWATIKYNTNLNFQWSAVHSSGADDHIPAGGTIAVDYAGRVVVVGWAVNATNDWQIVKCSAGGTSLWDKTIDTGNDEGAWGVAVDNAGYIYVNGDFNTGTGWDCRTIKYDADGNVQWDVTYDGGSNYNDAGRGVAVDDAGFVYVVGHSHNGSDHDYLTIKYGQQSGIEENPTTLDGSVSLEIFPNVTRDRVTISYSTTKSGNVRIYLLDISGRRIKSFGNNYRQAGVYSDEINTSSFSSGSYFLEINTPDRVFTRILTIVK